MSHDWVSGSGFVPGGSVDVDVNGSVSSLGVDSEGRFFFNPGPDLVPGDVVTVTDGVTVKDHVVLDLSVGVVDADTDVVSGGTNELGFGVDVWVNGGPQTQDVAPDGSGVWSVDFMAEFGHDLQPGDNGGVNQPDVDGDRTQLDWFAAGEPVFGVDPVHDQVDGWGWAPDVPLEVTIPGSPLGTYEWQTGGDGSFWFDIHNWPDEERFDIVAGATITVSDGSSTKSLVVSDLVVNPLAGPDQIPVGATTIAGVGDETQGPVVVEAWSLGEDYPTTFTVNDWVSDTFSQVLVRGDNGVVIQTEADDSEGLGDQTRVQWRVPYPAFTVNPENDGVWGDQWAPGLLVSVEVFESDESTSKGTAEGFADGDGQFQIDLSAETVPIDVVPGDFVAVTDGVTAKTHSVIDLSVGVVDADTDVVSGSTGELGFGVDVWVNGGPQTQDVAPDGSGDWSVDFIGRVRFTICSRVTTVV